MRSQLSSILRFATRNVNEPLNILNFATHESYQSNLCKTGHNFYSFYRKGLKQWQTKYRPVPANYTLLEEDSLPSDLEFDLILSQNHADQYPIAKQLSLRYGVPLVTLNHCLPHPDTPKKHLDYVKSFTGDVNVFISEHSRKAWGFAEDEAVVVHHAVDTDVFKPREQGERDRVLLSVCNEFVNRNWCLGYDIWDNIVNSNPKLPIRLLGDTPGLSEPAKDVNDLANAYKNSQIFLTTTTFSPIPSVILEAMSSGCCVISTATCMIPEIIKHGYNGLISNDIGQLRYFCETMLNDPLKCEEYGRNARKTILENFSLEKFINNWNKVFYSALKN